MGIIQRKDSPFYWLHLERFGQAPIRESTKIPIDAPTRSGRTENRKLADAAYAVRMRELARARYRVAEDQQTITFKDYRAWYLAHISAHKRNQAREASMLKQLGAHFDDVELHRLDLQTAREWRTTRAQHVAPATVNRELELLKHLLATAVPKYLESNPLAGMPRLRVPEREIRILSHEEEGRLLAPLDTEDRALVLCALDTLQRLSSVADLQWAQDHTAYLTFLNTKTKGGKVPVSTRLRVALDALTKTNGYVFPRYQGVTVGSRRNAVIRMFTAACDAAQIRGLTFHGLRHTGASRMLERGVDLETVRRIGGWANLTILQRYLHPSDAASKAAVETIGRTG